MNKKFVPTAQQRENVEAMVGFGIPQDKICLLIKNQNTKKPIDGKTLRKYFPDEIATGETKANAQVAGSLFKDATSCPNDRARVAASSFWLKMRAGWKDTTVHELVGKDGGPIQTENALTILSAELDRIAERLAGDASGAEAEDDTGEDSSET
jgi:hypothetical protein